jgi:hypothetical protein
MKIKGVRRSGLSSGDYFVTRGDGKEYFCFRDNGEWIILGPGARVAARIVKADDPTGQEIVNAIRDFETKGRLS